MLDTDNQMKIFLLILSTIIPNAAFDYPCQAPYHCLTTNTPYTYIHGNDSTSFEGCEAQTIWALVNNGAHYPDIPEMISFVDMSELRDSILENYDRYSSSELCKTEIELFRNWKFQADFTKAMTLSRSGYKELFTLGRRLEEHFPHLLNINNTSNITVRTTSECLTEMSSEALVRGTSVFKYIEPIGDDQLLMNEVNCTAWEISMKGTKVQEAIKDFLKSNDLKKLVRDTTRRLGFLKELGFDAIKIIYNLCGYETSWKPSVQSPWCYAFKEEDLKVMEYFWDLSYYYESGYGNLLTEKLGCEILADLINKLKEDQSVTLNFGNALSIRKLLVTLGIAEDEEPLKGDGYPNAGHRQWRTSILTPTSANILVVLYRCVETSSLLETSRLAIFLNENLVALPACNDQKMCGLSEFMNFFQPKTVPNVCNKDFCDKNVEFN